MRLALDALRVQPRVETMNIIAATLSRLQLLRQCPGFRRFAIDENLVKRNFAQIFVKL